MGVEFLMVPFNCHHSSQVLDRPEFRCIEKIKTISTTFMAASGLTGDTLDNSHIVAVAKFAISLLALIDYINEHSFNSFNLRIGELHLITLFGISELSSEFRHQPWSRRGWRHRHGEAPL